MNELKEKALYLDSIDALKKYREEFYYPEKDGEKCIYFCGNSLGLQPRQTASYLNAELNNWRDKGVEGHFDKENPWVKYHFKSKESLSKLLGAKENEVVAMNNLTVNLHLALTTFYRPKGTRTKIIIERGAFPSDYYAVYSQMVTHGLDPEENIIQLNPGDGSDYLPSSEIVEKIKEVGEKLAVVLFPGIQYYTGQFFDLKAISEAAHLVGAKVGFDLAHAIGNVPLNLHEVQADFAVWCTYKYLNSGPGNVGGLFIHENHVTNKKLPRLSGWWGHDADGRFKMDNSVNPIPTVDGWQLSNLNILAHAVHLSSLELFDRVGLTALRDKSIKLTGFLEEMLTTEEVLKKNLSIITPSNPNERGCQLSLFLTNSGKEVFNFLINRGVVLDWREPNVMRVAPVPLYNSFSEVYEFVEILKSFFIEKHS